MFQTLGAYIQALPRHAKYVLCQLVEVDSPVMKEGTWLSLI